MLHVIIVIIHVCTCLPTGVSRMVINCDQIYECRSKQLTCPESGGCTVNCHSPYGCVDAAITCSGRGRDCIINCLGSGYYSCTQASIICPSGATCTINCIGPDSCARSNILCQQGSSCRVNCGSSYGCYYANLVDGGGNFIVTCNDRYGCYKANVFCDLVGSENSCHTQCFASSSSNFCRGVSVQNPSRAFVSCCTRLVCHLGRVQSGVVNCSR